MPPWRPSLGLLSRYPAVLMISVVNTAKYSDIDIKNLRDIRLKKISLRILLISYCNIYDEIFAKCFSHVHNLDFLVPLTHCGWKKWLIFCRRHFQRHFLKWRYFRNSIWIPTKFLLVDAAENASVLVWVMGWRRKGDKPLPEPMMTKFTDTY